MFDPYVQWFKIPEGQRPPTYYELLDLTPDQARDPVAVREAAERRSDQLLLAEFCLGVTPQDDWTP